MKKLLSIVSVAAVMTACNTNQKTNPDAAAVSPAVQQASSLNADTSGLSQFREWKAQQDLAAANENKQTVRYITVAPAKKTKKAYHAPVYKETESDPVPSATTASYPGTSTTTGTPASESGAPGTIPNSTEDVAMSSESANTAEAPEKKGWSKAAKGAVIGAAGGAVAGAVINKKNRAVGAVIGGVVGAGGGYVIGRKIDKKDGRY